MSQVLVQKFGLKFVVSGITRRLRRVVRLVVFAEFDAVIVALTEDSQGRGIEHRAAFGDRLEVVHLEASVACRVSERARLVAGSYHRSELLPPVGLVPLAGRLEAAAPAG